MPVSYRSKKKKSKNKILATTLLVLLLALGGSLAYYFTNNNYKDTSSNSSKFYVPASSADNNLNNERKGSSKPAQTLDNGASATSETSGTFTVQLGDPTQITYNGKPAIHISNTVSGITSGACTLTASQNGGTQISLATSQVALDVNYYDCGPFNIEDSSFTSNGTWEINLTVTNNGTSASASTTADITNT